MQNPNHINVFGGRFCRKCTSQDKPRLYTQKLCRWHIVVDYLAVWPRRRDLWHNALHNKYKVYAVRLLQQYFKRLPSLVREYINLANVVWAIPQETNSIFYWGVLSLSPGRALTRVIRNVFSSVLIFLTASYQGELELYNANILYIYGFR